MMSLSVAEQVLISPMNQRLLFANGAIDRERGADVDTGWMELCCDMGWDEEAGLTPAKEYYTAGWNSVQK